MAKLLIVYHSKTGGTRQMAEAAAEAARAEAEVKLIKAKPAGKILPMTLFINEKSLNEEKW